MNSDSSSTFKRNIVLIVSTVTGFIIPFLLSAVNVAIPTLQSQFSMKAVAMTWVSTIYFLSVAVVQVPCGRLADIYGRRKLFVIGLLVTIAASAVGATAKSVAMLLSGMSLMGMGGGIMFNSSVSILTSVFPPDKRGRVLGISTAGTYAGLSFGPYLGGVLTRMFGWQSIFMFVGALNVVVLALVFYALKGEWREAEGEKFDFIGTVTYGISIVLFVYGFSSLPDVLGAILLVLGAAGLVLFARWEARTASPIFDVSLFKENRAFLFSNLAVFVSYIATYAVSFLLSIYLQDIKGLHPDRAGLVLITASVLMAIFTPLSGRISDKIEARLVASVGMSFNCVALLLMAFINNAMPIWYIVLALAVNGLGIGIFSSPNTNAIMSSVDKKSLGVAAGTMGTMRTAGMMVSMGTMMILFSLYIGQTEITPVHYPQFLASLRTGFIIFTVVSVLGLLCQLIARSPARQRSSFKFND